MCKKHSTIIFALSRMRLINYQRTGHYTVFILIKESIQNYKKGQYKEVYKTITKQKTLKKGVSLTFNLQLTQKNSKFESGVSLIVLTLEIKG